MSDKPRVVDFALTQNELLFILATIDAEPLPGMEEDELPSLDDEAALQPLLEAGARSLAEKQYLYEATDAQVRLDAGIQAALTVCANPTQFMMVMSRLPSAVQKQLYLYRIPEMVVLHTITEEMRHEFAIIAPDVACQLVKLLNEPVEALPEMGQQTESYLIHQDLLADIHARGKDQASTWAKQLSSAGMTPEDAQRLSKTLETANCGLMVQFVYEVAPSVNQKMFNFVSDGESTWCFELDDPGADEVGVFGVSRQDALGLVETAFAPLC